MEDLIIEKQVEQNFYIDESQPISVYVMIDENGYITDICSDAFARDLSNFYKIDEGFGDKYAHAQSQYFKKELFDNNKFNYKFENGNIVEI